MLDFTILFKMAGCGIALLVIDKVLDNGGKKEISTIINVVGVIILLMMALSLVGDLFSTVKTMFLF
ncbi:MAG: stage III sporulation protein AC [Clostridium sp.]